MRMKHGRDPPKMGRALDTAGYKESEKLVSKNEQVEEKAYTEIAEFTEKRNARPRHRLRAWGTRSSES